MKSRFCVLFAVAGLALLLPSAQVHSQLPAPVPVQPAAPVTDPVAALQQLLRTNEDLLKRQQNTLKDLTDMTTSAREARIFARRG